MSETQTYKNRLLAMYISVEAIPKGGGFSDGVNFILNPELRKKGIETAEKKMAEAISVIRSFPGYENKSDEEIAKILVDKINERKREVRND